VTVVREAIVLPIVFLTATLLAGVQPGAPASVTAPSPFSLVLATMLLAALVRSGALDPSRLLRSTRPALANANGLAVLATFFIAAAQVFSMLTPRTGLPLFFVDVFLLALLLNTLVALPDRVRLLRSLAVILGSAFLVTFVLLAGLSDPSGSRVSRILVALFDAATFGTMTQQPSHPAAPYLAFAAAALFLVGVAMLPTQGSGFEVQRSGSGSEFDIRAVRGTLNSAKLEPSPELREPREPPEPRGH
jgi:hypothetical protein